MASAQNVSRYQAMAAGAETLESCLKGQLAEYLNAEIVLLTVCSEAQAVDWLKSTFLYIRASLHSFYSWGLNLAPHAILASSVDEDCDPHPYTLFTPMRCLRTL